MRLKSREPPDTAALSKVKTKELLELDAAVVGTRVYLYSVQLDEVVDAGISALPSVSLVMSETRAAVKDPL